MSKFELKLGTPGSNEIELLVDGIDLSGKVRQVSVYIEPNELPQVTLELAVFQETNITGESYIFMSDDTAEILKEWGWTPPKPGTGIREVV